MDLANCDHYTWSAQSVAVVAGSALRLPVAIRGPTALVLFVFAVEHLDVELQVLVNDGKDEVVVRDAERVSRVKDSVRINAGRDADSLVLTFRVSNEYSWWAGKNVSYRIEAYVPRPSPPLLAVIDRIAESRPLLAASQFRLVEASAAVDAAARQVEDARERLAAAQTALDADVARLAETRAQVGSRAAAVAASEAVLRAHLFAAAVAVLLQGRVPVHAHISPVPEAPTEPAEAVTVTGAPAAPEIPSACTPAASSAPVEGELQPLPALVPSSTRDRDRPHRGGSGFVTLQDLGRIGQVTVACSQLVRPVLRSARNQAANAAHAAAAPAAATLPEDSVSTTPAEPTQAVEPAHSALAEAAAAAAPLA